MCQILYYYMIPCGHTVFFKQFLCRCRKITHQKEYDEQGGICRCGKATGTNTSITSKSIPYRFACWHEELSFYHVHNGEHPDLRILNGQSKTQRPHGACAKCVEERLSEMMKWGHGEYYSQTTVWRDQPNKACRPYQQLPHLPGELKMILLVKRQIRQQSGDNDVDSEWSPLDLSPLTEEYYMGSFSESPISIIDLTAL